MMDPTDLRTLRSFVTVAREGNISRAAEVLHLTQPAISLQLKRLSRDTGLVLFRRTSKGVELTRDGAALLVKAEQVLAAMADFGQTARRMTGAVRGTLRVGTIVDPDFIRLGQFLGDLVKAAPELRTQLIHGMSGDVPVRLLRGEIDAGYFLGDLDGEGTGGAEAAHFHYRRLTRFKYRVIAPAGWERRTEGLGWKELAALPWIGTPPASVHRRLLDRIFSGLGVAQNQVAVVDQEPSMLAMVRSGVGLSLCRESIAWHEKQVHGVVVVDQAEVEATLGFLALASRQGEPGIDLAFEILGKIWMPREPERQEN
ncbi:LysR family transcriptional regulator [Paracoccus sp. N5]|uniref:LysR family transcriptional regulator n=1 Tax=Paracoccus sp. N5 TaxID=1101189 RepID=UPI00037A7335|nr:LysR family transcriptional regulator [Paracoccus sp. N5]